MDDAIKKLYIEPTSECNLSCPMCSRNYWVDEKKGHMSYDLFEKIIAEAAELKSIETVFFGGIGEPLFHPRIIDMIKAAKETGKRVEIITNGTLLNGELSRKLVQTEPDRLWISIDGIDEPKYESIRRGAEFQSVTQNIKYLNAERKQMRSRLELGLSFVLMRKNADQLPKLPAFARKYRIMEIKVTNLIPNTREMVEETLYTRALTSFTGPKGSMVKIDLPVFDMADEVKEPLFSLFRSYAEFYLMGTPLKRQSGYCRFVNEGNVFVRWDGEVCPCMSLLHSGKTYLHDYERHLKFATFGNIRDKSLMEIWQSDAYASFRNKVVAFDFAPCTLCGSCDKLESNEEDCFNNTFPVCGGCLWAQGFIQCP